MRWSENKLSSSFFFLVVEVICWWTSVQPTTVASCRYSKSVFARWVIGWRWTVRLSTHPSPGGPRKTQRQRTCGKTMNCKLWYDSGVERNQSHCSKSQSGPEFNSVCIGLLTNYHLSILYCWYFHSRSLLKVQSHFLAFERVCVGLFICKYVI